MSIPGFSISAPDWYVEAEKSGALTQIKSENTIYGYYPYQRARQCAIITGVATLILFAIDGPEKSGCTVVAIFFAVLSFCCKMQFEKEKVEIIAIHQKIMLQRESLNNHLQQ